MGDVSDVAEDVVRLLTVGAPSNLPAFELARIVHGAHKSLTALWMQSFDAGRAEAAGAFIALGQLLAARTLLRSLLDALLYCATRVETERDQVKLIDLHLALKLASARSEFAFAAVRARTRAVDTRLQSEHACRSESRPTACLLIIKRVSLTLGLLVLKRRRQTFWMRIRTARKSCVCVLREWLSKRKRQCQPRRFVVCHPTFFFSALTAPAVPRGCCKRMRHTPDLPGHCVSPLLSSQLHFAGAPCRRCDGCAERGL